LGIGGTGTKKGKKEKNEKLLGNLAVLWSLDPQKKKKTQNKKLDSEEGWGGGKLLKGQRTNKTKNTELRNSNVRKRPGEVIICGVL